MTEDMMSVYQKIYQILKSSGFDTHEVTLTINSKDFARTRHAISLLQFEYKAPYCEAAHPIKHLKIYGMGIEEKP